MSIPASQSSVVSEGVATYERIRLIIPDLETEEAICQIQNFLKVYPAFAQGHNDVAVLYYQNGNHLKALAHYEKAHKLDPGNITYRKNLADFYFVELAWADDAIQTYLEILQDNPFDLEALNALGTISIQTGRRKQARQYFSRVVQLDANNRDARQRLQQLDAPLAIPSGAEQTPENLPSPSQEPSQPTLAAAVLVPPQAVQAPPPTPVDEPFRSPEELYREAVTLMESGGTDAAMQVLEQLVAQDHDHAVAHNDLGVLYQRKGELQRSLRHHEEAARLQPASTIFQKNLADLLCAGFEDMEGALRIYVQLLAKAPQDVEILKAIAQICLQSGKDADARFFLDQVLNLKPWDTDAREALRAMEEAEAAREIP